MSKVDDYFRENRLWGGSRMMLPEHRAGGEIRRLEEAAETYLPCPSEDLLEEMGRQVAEAHREGREITLQVARLGRVFVERGIPVEIGRDHLLLRQPNGERKRLALASVVGLME